uniref:Dehydrogenase/reductase SDR family member 7C n=1 Tax=Amazona collaria TaxID=241587 RepID=A0A8B9FAJ2_9PSIT
WERGASTLQMPKVEKMGIFAVLALPLLLFGISGVIYIYQSVRWLLSKSAVQNKVVVITDAISGLGKGELSHFFAVLENRNRNALAELFLSRTEQRLATEIHTMLLILLDITDINCIRDVAKEILNCYGCVDILINNASMKVKGAVQSISLELDKKIMDANYFGPITLTKAILPNMISRRTGQIVLINSIQGKIGIPFRAAYAASKHAAVGFFDCLRAEMEEYDISVSTVNPTFILAEVHAAVAYGVHPVEVAEEVLRTVSSKKQEVLMANPIPRAAVYIRTFFPELFFAIVASGIREKQKTEEEN